MSATGLDVFDKTLQTTNIWLDQIWRQSGRIANWLGVCWERCCGACETG
jgi:hypothetical protein